MQSRRSETQMSSWLSCERIKKDAAKELESSEEWLNRLHQARESAVESYRSSKEYLDLRDETRKEAINLFRTSDDFCTAVWEESVRHYNIGFKACKFQFLKSGQLPKGFNFNFLDAGTGLLGKSPGQVPPALSVKSIKPEI